MENDQTHSDLTRRVLNLEVALEQLHRRSEAQMLMLGWTLATLCPDEARRFLALQANELEGTPRHAEDVALFDDLTEEIARFLALWRQPRTPPKFLLDVLQEPPSE